jgi:hypothetical protein
MKNKIEVGQVYRWDDHAYMVIDFDGGDVIIEDTLTKILFSVAAWWLVKQQRPFPNWWS